MQFTDVLCYTIFTITVAVTCVEAGEQRMIDRKDMKFEKRLGRRDSILMIENPIDRALQKSKVIYRRVSQSERFAPQKPKYGVPGPRYKSYMTTKFPRKPGKKPRSHRPKHLSSKYLPKPSNKHKKRSYKPRYGPPPKQRPKPEFAHLINQAHYTNNFMESTGFGEPPTNYANDYLPPKKSYGEPPVDSYGVPLKSINEALRSSPKTLYDNTDQFEKQNYYNYQTYPPWDHNKDTYFAYSTKYQSYAKPEFDEKDPSYTKPEPNEKHHSYGKPEFDDKRIKHYTEPDIDEKLITQIPQGYNDNAHGYNDDFDEIEEHQQKQKERKYLRNKPQYVSDNSIVVNKTWKLKKRPDPEIIVGGRYAEPPARYVAKFKPSSSIALEDNVDSFVPRQGYDDDEIGSSATNSPYVNYKHSNMAFSPQNLNDAFSIVDK